MTKMEEHSIAKSYWTYCYPLGWHEHAHYLLGINVPPDANQEDKAAILKQLARIPLLSRTQTMNLSPGVVRQILSDITWQADYAQV